MRLRRSRWQLEIVLRHSLGRLSGPSPTRLGSKGLGWLARSVSGVTLACSRRCTPWRCEVAGSGLARVVSPFRRWPSRDGSAPSVRKHRTHDVDQAPTDAQARRVDHQVRQPPSVRAVRDGSDHRSQESHQEPSGGRGRQGPPRSDHKELSHAVDRPRQPRSPLSATSNRRWFDATNRFDLPRIWSREQGGLGSRQARTEGEGWRPEPATRCSATWPSQSVP